MDYTLITEIQSLIKSGNNTIQNVYSIFGSDTIEIAVTEGYLNKNDNFIFLTEKGIKLTKPLESNMHIDGNLILS